MQGRAVLLERMLGGTSTNTQVCILSSTPCVNIQRSFVDGLSRVFCRNTQHFEQLKSCESGASAPVDGRSPFSLNIAERAALARDFTELHEWSFMIASRSFSFDLGRKRGQTFDANAEGITFTMHHNSEYDGNPALAFSVERVGTWRLDECRALQGRTEAEQLAEHRWRAEFGDQYLGRLCVRWVIEDFVIDCSQCSHIPETEYEAGREYDWFEELRHTISEGLVHACPSRRDGQDWGTMRREGKMWKWTPLPMVTDANITSSAKREAQTMGSETMAA